MKKKLIKSLLISLSLFSLSIPAFSQNKTFAERTDFVVKIPPSLLTNSFNDNLSPKFSVIYPVGIGFRWPNDTFISTEPTISFFSGYYKWKGEKAVRAPVELRTTSTLSFLINMPVVFSFNLQHVNLSAYGGAAFLLQFSFPAPKIDKDEMAEDIKYINEFFWNKGRFLYLSAGTCVLFSNSDSLSFGPLFEAYIPLGSLFNNEGFNAGIFSVGLKLVF